MSYQALFEKLNQNTVVLTANTRLADKLVSAVSNAPVSVRPKIDPISHYLSHRYHELALRHDLPSCLTSTQAEFLWQQILKGSDDDLGLISPAQTAKTLARAYRHLKKWNLNLADIEPESVEVSRFLEWGSLFERRLKDLDAIISDEIPTFLEDDCLANHYILTGFDDISPIYQHLFDAWKDKGAMIETFEVERSAGQKAVSCASAGSELAYAASTAKIMSENNQSVTIIVPDLNAKREEIETTFLDVFEPAKSLQAERIPTQFRMTGGQALPFEPIVAEALAFLKYRSLKGAYLISLIRSPYMPEAQTYQDEREAMALLLQSKSISNIDQFLHQLNAFKADEALMTVFENMQAINIQVNSLFDFKAMVLNLLQAAGFPGNMQLGSREYQALNKFYEALDAFVLQNRLCDQLSYQDAISMFEDFSAGILFQAESEQAANVTICGLLEAVGEMSDVMIITGLNQQYFPERAKPNPYLPIDLQRSHRMPHCDGLRQLDFATQLLDNLSRGPSELIATFALADQDIELQPSSLIETWPVEPFEGQDISLSKRIFDSKSNEQVLDDWQASSLSGEDVQQIKGGVSIFKRMVACPFQAFAAHRLKLRAIDDDALPLDLATRGVILHDVLDKLWASAKTSDELSSLTAQIEPVVLKAINAYNQRYPNSIPQYLKALETQRLTSLMHEWLELESDRVPFEVCAHEKSVFGNIGGLPIHGRIDRVDSVAGQQLLIDYKSGKIDQKSWFAEKLPEPQLPIYALLTGASAIAFAKVATGSVAMEGVAIEAIDDSITAVIDKSPFDSWVALTDFWQSELNKTAQEFIAGTAVVNPHLGEATCRTCDFKTLCRRQWI